MTVKIAELLMMHSTSRTIRTAESSFFGMLVRVKILAEALFSISGFGAFRLTSCLKQTVRRYPEKQTE